MIQAPDFSTYIDFDYLSAIRKAIALAKTRIETIKAQPTQGFAAIVALETCDEELNDVLQIFYNLLGTDSTDTLQELAQEIGPLGAAFASDVSQDEGLFAIIKKLWDTRDTLGLTPVQTMVLEKHYLSFVRNGALLDAKAKARIKDIDAEESRLGPSFADNYRKSSKAFTLLITDEAELAGLPASARTAAAEEADAKGHAGAWLFTLDYPSYGPFMMYADRRDLRERMWRAFARRAFGDDFDNQALVKTIVGLRHERAQLLGYKDYASYVLERRMAETPAQVHAFLERLTQVALPAAKSELNELEAFAKEAGATLPLKPWDVSYYAEKLKQARYAFDAEQLRPYFPVDAVLKGCFAHCERLFGLSFKAASGYPLYHPDVQTYEVVDTESGKPLGLLYADFHPRDGKRSGAWQSTFRERRITCTGGNVALPLAAIVCNFTKPTREAPSLLTFDEVETLFHEMGHALHTLLTDIDYPSISGTSVYWDFVELPSQIMENWLTEKETLDLFARHYQTDAPIPAPLLDALKQSQNFMAGSFLLRQIQLCTLDMAWHSTNPALIGNVLDFERQTLAPLTLMPYEDGCVSTSFGHLFAGGYAAGYYSYQWAEVLDADAFSLFVENGLYHAPTGRAFREHVLSKGGSEHPLALFTRFRGRAPDPDAALRKRGLLPDTAQAA